MKILRDVFVVDLDICRFYVLSIEKIYTVSSLPWALFMVRFPSQDLRTEFCITVHAPYTSFLASSKAE